MSAITEAERLEAERLVVGYARGLDAREWAAYRALSADEVAIDYSSLGTTHGVFPAQTWVDRCRVLGGFDGTLHRVTNMFVDRAGQGLSVHSYVDAVHFITRGMETLQAHACGRYRHELVHWGDGWRIAACTFEVVGFPGGRAAFDQAFALARARHAEGAGA